MNKKFAANFFMLLFFTVLLFGCAINQKHTKNKAGGVSNNKTVSSIINNDSEKTQILYHGTYSGWICGLTANKKSIKNSDVLLIHPETKQIKKLTTLKGVDSGQTCAVSNDGHKIAYTQWLSQNPSEGVCLCVKDLKKGTTKKYFSDVIKELTIPYMSWMPDNKGLLMNLSIMDLHYYSNIISLLDTDEGKLDIIDKGHVWMGNSTLDFEKGFVYSALTQDELNHLIDKYGGSEYIPVDENGSFNFTEFSMPMLSPDQTKILYRITFCRSDSVGENFQDPPPLMLASGLFVADVNGQSKPKLVYGNNVKNSSIGRAIWGRDNDEIIFDRFYDEFSHGISDIVSYHISTKTETVLLKTSAITETQKPAFLSDSSKLGICIDGKNGEDTYYYNFGDCSYKKEKVLYKKEKIMLWNFSQIY